MFKTFLIIIIVLLSYVNCEDIRVSREDNSFRDAVALYYLRCTGGSLNACQSSCNGKCGVAQGANVTTDKLPCLNSCQSECSSNCDLSIPVLIYLARNPINK